MQNIYSTGNKYSFKVWMRRFFYCSDQIVIKVSKYVLSGRSDGLASKDNVHYKTQVSLFFGLVWSHAVKMYKQWPCSIRLSAGGWPTACSGDTTVWLISEIHEQVHVGQPTSFYHLEWLSPFDSSIQQLELFSFFLSR